MLVNVITMQCRVGINRIVITNSYPVTAGRIDIHLAVNGNAFAAAKINPVVVAHGVVVYHDLSWIAATAGADPVSYTHLTLPTICSV